MLSCYFLAFSHSHHICLATETPSLRESTLLGNNRHDALLKIAGKARVLRLPGLPTFKCKRHMYKFAGEARVHPQEIHLGFSDRA